MNMKLKDSTIKARINGELKNSVEEKLSKLGLDSATVIRMLYHYIENFNNVPFDLTIPNVPNEETLEAIEDVRNKKNLTTVTNIDDLKKELNT